MGVGSRLAGAGDEAVDPSGALMSGPYARGGTSDTCKRWVPRSSPRSEIGAMRRLIKDVAEDHHRAIWRRAVQARTSMISRAVRFVAGALAEESVRRERRPGGWVFLKEVANAPVPVVVLVLPPSRTLDDLKMVVSVAILEPELLKPSTLERLRGEPAGADAP
jgi:hypothetical protein